MTVPFKELAGSPTEAYTKDGFRGHREFLVAWSDREQFIRDLLGESAALGPINPAHYPGKDSCLVTDVRIEPFDRDNPDDTALVSLTEGLNTYGDGFAKVAVDYEYTPDEEDEEEKEPGTFLRWQIRASAQFATIPGRAMSWYDRPDVPVADDLNLNLLIPTAEHVLTWRRVASPPWSGMSQLLGCVNAGAFLGKAAETMLFEGYDADKEFQYIDELGDPLSYWKIVYRFRERAVKSAAGIVGWNHEFREKPAGWARLVKTDGQPPYPTGDLSSLFYFAPGA